ncbi:hypothetical protein Tco_0164355 [Tanacetum coccineum]
MKIIPDKEEVAIDAIPLATKPPTIIDWKIYKKGKKNYYQIIRANGSSKMYLVFSHMLKSFDREDFETLWKLVKAKYGSTRLVEDLYLILWGDLKTMFEPYVEDKYKVNATEGVNAASEEVNTAKLVSTAYVIYGQAVTRKILKARKQLGEFHIRWKIKTGNVLDSCNQGKNLTLLAKVTSSAIGFKTTIDMLGFFVGLLLLNKGMLEVVKVKFIFMGYHKGTSLVQVLQGVEFEVEPWEDHTFEMKPRGNVGHVAGSEEVQTKDLIDYHAVCDREQHSALELFRFREDNKEVAFVVAELEKIYARKSFTFNYTISYVVISKLKAELKEDTYISLYTWFYKGKLVQTLLEGHSILLMECSLSRDFDMERMTRDTVTEGVLGPERDKLVSKLTAAENERYKADIRAINILLQGLPKDIYTLINHDTTAKDIWDNVQMILEGSEMTRDEIESQLYDDFEHFQKKKGEPIYDYYVRFSKLVNDMRNIKMTMPKIQLNSKFVNNMQPEWGRFVTAVKLNRGLKNSNHDQLESTPIDDLLNNLSKTIALLSNSYKSYLPQINNQLRTASNTRNQATVQNGRVVVQNVQGRQQRGQGNNLRGANATRNGGVQNRGATANPGQANPIKCYNCNSSYSSNNVHANLTSTGPVYDESGLSYDSDILSEVHEYDIDLDTIGENHEVQETSNNVQLCYDVKTDADYTNESNMISYDQYVQNNAAPVVQGEISSIPNDDVLKLINDMHEQVAACHAFNEQHRAVNESLTAELARYKEEVNMYEKGLEASLKKELQDLQKQLNSTVGHNKSMAEEVEFIKTDFKRKEDKYLDDFLNLKNSKKR